MSTKRGHNTFRAFRNRNYTLFFFGQSTSQIGTWMQRTAVSWLIYSLTHSAFMLGLTVFAQQFPSFLLSLVGGIVADRYRRYKILLVTQTASMVQAILLAVLVLSGRYFIWEILALSVVLGIINAFDTPARQPMVHALVHDREDITNALAFNSAMVNIARLVGPALSGIVLQAFGAGVCFSLNALSFVAVIASLLLMKLPPHQHKRSGKSAMAELAEGFQYLRQAPAIGMVIIFIMLLALFVFPYDTLIPIFAKTVYHGDAATFGYITSAMGLGAVGGSFFLASLKKGTNLKTVLLGNVAILGISMIFFSQMVAFRFAIPFAVLVGFSSLTPMTASISMIQLEAASNMRGRMMSFIAMAFFGMLPLGSLLTGVVSQRIGAPLTVLCQGITALIIVVVFFRFLKEEKSAGTAVTAEAEAIKS